MRQEQRLLADQGGGFNYISAYDGQRHSEGMLGTVAEGHVWKLTICMATTYKLSNQGDEQRRT